MSEGEVGGAGLTRRQVVESLLLMGVLGTAGLDSSQASAQAPASGEEYEQLRKTLIERLINTRYYQAPDGSIVVLSGDEVWPGESGGAYHADWLFNETYGLTSNPRAALEDSIVTDKVHKGIASGTDLSLVAQILDSTKALGLFDDIGLIYQVMREKFSIETIGAHAHGVRQFREWALANEDLTPEQRAVVSSAAMSFLNVAHPHEHHLPY